MEFSLHNEGETKLVSSLSLTMDYDSGYMSHNPESNLDSSLESNSNENMLKNEFKKPIYLSEDALLEKPEVKHNSLNLSLEIENENYEETRNLFYSPETNTSESIISDSVISQETNYSGFDDSESENNVSPVIPKAKPLIVDMNIKNISNSIYSDEKDNCNDIICNNASGENNFSGKLDKQDLKAKMPSALTNITNTFATNPNKKLTLIFSREDKENYSVKRKFPSISPKLEKSLEHSELSSINSSLEESYLSEKSFSTTTETDKSTSLTESRDFDNSSTGTNACVPCTEPLDDINGILEQSSNKILENESLRESLDAEIFTKPLNSSVMLNNLNLDYDYENNSIYDNALPNISKTITQEEIASVNRLFERVVGADETTQNEDKSANNLCSVESIKTISPKRETICKNIEVKNYKVFTNQIDDNSQSLSNISEITVNNTFDIPEIINISATPKKQFQNPINPNTSPDLFDEEDVIEESPSEDPACSNKIAAEKYIIKKDYILIKRAYDSLKGVIPPHSVTVVQMSIDEMLNKIEANKNYFWNNKKPVATCTLNTSTQSTNSSDGGYKSLLISEPIGPIQKKEFPAVLEGRYLGVHYNRSKLSEQFEELCTKYAQRYVGAETQSSCTTFEVTNSSPLKRKQIKQRWSVKSPGRRLSHLARRRITFSSANLQASSSFAGTRARQILVDAKKLDLLKQKSPRKSPRKTPKKTPSKSPRIKTRTPSSSAKKKLAMRFRKVTGEIETTGIINTNSGVLSSKRALFRSPSRDQSSRFASSTSGVSTFEKEAIKTTKRALFMSPSKNSPLKKSPFKKSPFKRLESGNERKRRRSDSEDTRPLKLPRTASEILKPSESEFKTSEKKNTFNISLSQGQIGELSAAHKKKLQWAVYEALRTQDITPSHPQFRLFASILVRVTRRLLPYVNSGITGKEIGTSERMLRITRHHVYSVIKGKSVDEIVDDYLRNRAKHSKPQGYISIEESNSTKKKESVLQDKSNLLESIEKKKLDSLGKSKVSSNIERIRKVINFGDDDNR